MAQHVGGFAEAKIKLAEVVAHYRSLFTCAKQEGSSSFLKKRTKKLLLDQLLLDRAYRASQHNKSLLVLFFRKELLSCFLS
jgi:hypothetical protein